MQDHVRSDEQPMDMEDRQRVDQPVLAGEPPGFQQRPAVGCEVAMGEHRAFGAAGGA